MRFEPDRSLSTAAGIIRERIRSLPEFSEARGLVVLAATDECARKSVVEMRAIGGFSEVVRRHINALGARYRQNNGSSLLPRSIVDELLADVGAMREAVQYGCSFY